MDSVIRFDTFLFLWINGRLTSPVLDAVMPFITEKFNFLGVIIIGAFVIVVKGRRRDIRSLIVIVIAVLVSDFLTGVFKEVFVRVRPCHALAGARMLVGCSGSFSFPSAHAANIFAAMVFLTTRYGRLSPAFMAVAAGVAYSRVYVGVHYPLDVIGGASLGAATALLFSLGDRRLVGYLIEYYRKRRGSVEA